MIIRTELEQTAAKQLAADFHCSPDDFFKYENTVAFTDDVRDGERPMWEQPCLFRAATMGMGAVICTSEGIAPYARILAASKSGAEICSAAVASALDRELFSHGGYIGTLKQYYLPRTPYRPHMVYEGYMITVFEGEEITELYQWKGFDNALLYRTSGERYDMTAVCAVNGRRIMGIAGASRDSSSMAQIGIDVLPEFRGMGIGKALVCACANEVFRQGYVPYYGTWSGNVISQRLSLDCCFYPVWTEMSAVSFGRLRQQSTAAKPASPGQKTSHANMLHSIPPEAVSSSEDIYKDGKLPENISLTENDSFGSISPAGFEEPGD